MSGIAGIVNLNGAPVDHALLRQMTEALAFRGPDAQQVWSEGAVGFGHALLRTTWESAHERQPCSLDGEAWIVADARVDARSELIARLESKGRSGLKAASDAELILHAYHVWGGDCVEHLLGDFAFAIWDIRRQRLFCARDHFGVKPFYYAQVGQCLVFSNTLDCVRMHPGVSDELNDQVIGDFLLFGLNLEFDTTPFADICRLPPSNTLTWSEGKQQFRRYWTLPIDEPIRYNRSGDYIARFLDLLRSAVTDRLRADHLGVFMSGGLDSTTIAATAKELLEQTLPSFDLRGYTYVYETLVPHEEGHYAEIAAQALGIPLHRLVADSYGLFEKWGEDQLKSPELECSPTKAVRLDQFRQAAANGRVVLTGEGGDPLLDPQCGPYVVGLIRSFQWSRLVGEIGSCVLSHRRIPQPLLGLRTKVRSLLGSRGELPAYPPWLNQEWEDRVKLPQRWKRQKESCPGQFSPHPYRPATYESLTHPVWPSGFEADDPGVTTFPVELRHPFFDLRLVRFLLALPPVPWCVDKELIREAMDGVLPQAVLLRPKAPFAKDLFAELFERPGRHRMDRLEPAPELARYVDLRRIPKTLEYDSMRIRVNLRLLSLNFWLQTTRSIRYKRAREECYELGGG